MIVSGKDINMIEDISCLINLKKLDLSSNSLKHPDSLNGLSYLPSLTVLNLGKNQLLDIDHIFYLKHLCVLNISHNLLTCLPTDLERLPSLKALIANNNQIRTLANVHLPITLNALVLSHNALEELNGSDIVHLKELSKLSVSHNRLFKIPPKLPDSLKELRANDNRLSIIPTLPSHLEIMDVGNNVIENIEPILMMKHLKSVNLKGNPIKSKDQVCQLPSLRVVDGRPVAGRSKKIKKWHEKARKK